MYIKQASMKGPTEIASNTVVSCWLAKQPFLHQPHNVTEKQEQNSSDLECFVDNRHTHTGKKANKQPPIPYRMCGIDPAFERAAHAFELRVRA